MPFVRRDLPERAQRACAIDFAISQVGRNYTCWLLPLLDPLLQDGYLVEGVGADATLEGGDRLKPGGFMNSIGRSLLVAGLALLPLLAQETGSQKQGSKTTQMMSMHDMMGHMDGMMGRMQGMMPMMQGNQMMQHMMDNMKTMGGNMNQMMNQIQGMMSDQSIMQNKVKKQHLENMSKHMQNMMQSMDGMLGDMEQMQKSK